MASLWRHYRTATELMEGNNCAEFDENPDESGLRVPRDQHFRFHCSFSVSDFTETKKKGEEKKKSYLHFRTAPGKPRGRAREPTCRRISGSPDSQRPRVCERVCERVSLWVSHFRVGWLDTSVGNSADIKGRRTCHWVALQCLTAIKLMDTELFCCHRPQEFNAEPD